jgi:large subunit ribosomal protein L4
MSVATYTKAGAKATTAAKLDKTVFEIKAENHELLKLVYTAYLANGRGNLAVTKTRGLVSGGGRKPWKQKGTGRARFGSTRNPIWRTGGIVFGPTGQENYTKSVNLKAKRLAIRQALTLATEDGKLIVMENLEVKSGKTADFVKLMTKVGATGRVLIAVDHKSEELVKASRNLGDVKLVQATYLNVYDLLNADHVVITEAALKAVSEWLGGAK